MKINDIQQIFENIKIINIWRDNKHIKLTFSIDFNVLIFKLIIAVLGMILILIPRKTLIGSKIVFNIIAWDSIDKKLYKINYEYELNAFSAEIIDDFVESTEKYLIKEEIPFDFLEIRYNIFSVEIHFNK